MSGSVAWMWGWELGTLSTVYQQTGWTYTNVWTADVAHTADTFQPAAGYGGGNFSLYLVRQDGNGTSRISSPPTGQNSIGTRSRFIFHDGYKRVGSTAGLTYFGGSLLRFLNGISEVVRLSQTTGGVGTSALSLYVNSVLVGTTTTTYTGSQPWHRIVLDLDGPNGNYDVYVNGLLEISVTASGQTFASVNVVEFLPGTGTTGSPNGGYHDHAVLFLGGNFATGDLTLATNPTAGADSITIGAQTYTFDNPLQPNPNSVLVGGTVADTRRNLINAINLGPGAGTLYHASTPLNADVRAFEDLTLPGVHVKAKIIGTGPNAVITAASLTAGGDGWGGGTLTGGDSDPTNDLNLALGQVFIQGFKPNADVTVGSWDTQPTPGQPLYNNINDGSALTDFIETTTTPDAYVVGHESRADIDPAFAPSQVHAVQTIQISRASGAITSGRTTVDVPSVGEMIGDSKSLSAAGIMVNDLYEWRGNVTTDIDNMESGLEV